MVLAAAQAQTTLLVVLVSAVRETTVGTVALVTTLMRQVAAEHLVLAATVLRILAVLAEQRQPTHTQVLLFLIQAEVAAAGIRLAELVAPMRVMGLRVRLGQLTALLIVAAAAAAVSVAIPLATVVLVES